MLTNCQINNFQITKQIGSGAYGLVFHAIDLISENQYAVKAVMKNNDQCNESSDIKKSTLLQGQLYHYFKSFQNKLFLPSINLESIKSLTEEQLSNAPNYKEIALHLKVHSHQNVVTIHQVLESSLATFIVMDYYPRDLFTSIVDHQHFAQDGTLVKKVFLQLCSVIQHCHHLGVYHCDIKPENILLDSQDNVQLCDFGLSTTSKELLANVCVGSSYYMAPERISCPSSLTHGNEAVSFPTATSDIWSLGIILINLTCIRNPWLKAHQLEDHTFHYFTQDPKVLLKILPVSQDLFSILLDVLQLDPSKRIRLDKLMTEVSECTHFTQSGPLSQVPTLTTEQFQRFIIGDHGVALKKMLYEYYSNGEEEEEEEGEEEDTDYSSEEEAYLHFSSVDTTPNGSVDGEERVGRKSKAQDIHRDFKLQYMQSNLSTMTNYSNFSRWLPRY